MEYLKNKLLDTLFKYKKEPSLCDYSALNAVLLTLLKSPYFENGYKDYFISHVDKDIYALYQFSNDQTVPVHLNVYNKETDFIKDKIRNKRELPCPNVDRLPKNIIDSYNRILSYFIKDNKTLIRKLFSPNEIDFKQKYNIKIKRFADFNELEDFLKNHLGKHYDISLKNYGIQFHHHDYTYPKSRSHIIAYNDEDIVGLLSYLPRKHDNGLSFVSVSDSFLHHGISKRLYKEFINICYEEKKILKRSSPSDFSMENKGITESYDKLLLDSDILHIDNSGGRLYKSLLDHLDNTDNTYEKILSVGKPLCDKWLKVKRLYDKLLTCGVISAESEIINKLNDSLKNDNKFKYK